MTPKEKAKHLALKFTRSTDVIKPNKGSIEMALLCVDEILETKPLEKDYEDHGHLGREVWYNDKTDYWLSVKNELSLL